MCMISKKVVEISTYIFFQSSLPLRLQIDTRIFFVFFMLRNFLYVSFFWDW